MKLTPASSIQKNKECYWPMSYGVGKVNIEAHWPMSVRQDLDRSFSENIGTEDK